MTTTPTQLGRYKILDEIGRGAMGVVYLAKDPLIGRLVALKTFRMGQALAGSELDLFRNRFIREAQSAGILSHPNIVTIHDVVEQSEEGATFIAMEYVRGTDLKGVLASEGRLSLDEIVPVVTQVAEGLDYAHSRGVVHRDVKPANILITQERQVKLTDFGIARLDASSLTTEGQLLGTPNYMAPEQIQGQPTDHRADVFSLGVVLYEMLTGEKPFKGENVTVVTHRIVYDDYTAPEEHLGHQPPPLLDVLRRALAKDPDERFDSVREMAEALGSAVAEIRGEERLNETQVIEPVPPPEEDASGGAGSRSPAPPPDGSTAGAALSGGAARLAETFRRAGRSARRGAARLGAALASVLVRPGEQAPSPARLLLVAAVAAVTGWLVGGLLVFAAAGQAGPDLEPASLDRERIEGLPHLRAAQAHLDEGDPVAALAPLRRAERAAPSLRQLRVRRRQIEEQARSLGRLEDRADRVSQDLEEARIASGEGRWEDAQEAAWTVLAVEPDNEEAGEIAREADAALERIARRREAEARAQEAQEAREDRVAEAPAAEEPETSRSEPLRAEAEATGADRQAHLDLRFYSAVPEGVLTVYYEQEQLAREPYRFYRREGLFRNVPAAGTVEDQYIVPSGAATLRVLVALPGRPTISRVLEGNFPGGATRRLNVRLEDDHTLTARLE